MPFGEDLSEKFCKFKKYSYFCSPNRESGCGAVGLAHLLWEQGVLRSSRSTPTKIVFILCFFDQLRVLRSWFFFRYILEIKSFNMS